MARNIFEMMELREKNPRELSFVDRCELLADVWMEEADIAAIYEYAQRHLMNFYLEQSDDAVAEYIEEHIEEHIDKYGVGGHPAHAKKGKE